MAVTVRKKNERPKLQLPVVGTSSRFVFLRVIYDGKPTRIGIDTESTEMVILENENGNNHKKKR